MELSVHTDLRRRMFMRAALATFGTFFLNTVGSWLSLYSILWWYDMPMHFFGGLFTALLVIVFLLRYSWFQNASFSKIIITILAFTLVIALLWEGYELFVAIIVGNRHILLDSTSDIFFGLAGAVQALFIYFRHLRNLEDPKLAESIV